MPLPSQLLLPFASLDFSGRETVTLAEIAAKLGGSVDHYANLVEDGTLTALDLTRHMGSRRMIRIPIEEYRRFVLSRLTGKRRAEFLDELPNSTRSELADEFVSRMSEPERAALLRRLSAA